MSSHFNSFLSYVRNYSSILKFQTSIFFNFFILESFFLHIAAKWIITNKFNTSFPSVFCLLIFQLEDYNFSVSCSANFPLFHSSSSFAYEIIDQNSSSLTRELQTDLFRSVLFHYSFVFHHPISNFLKLMRFFYKAILHGYKRYSNQGKFFSKMSPNLIIFQFRVLSIITLKMFYRFTLQERNVYFTHSIFPKIFHQSKYP